MTAADPGPNRRKRGFERAAGLVQHRIRKAGEQRGFAVSRVLTHWDEIAGPDMAGRARPVKIGYATGGLGATLTLLTTGANAPFVEMGKEPLRQRVNAAYGYNAVARIQITQTAPQGFADPRAAFAAAPAAPRPDPQASLRAERAAEGIRDAGLRQAIEDMARKILSRPRPKGTIT